MGDGVTNSRVEQLRHVLGVHRRTLQRWRHWWRTVFAATPFWSMARGALMPPPNPISLPGGLLERFVGPDDAGSVPKVPRPASLALRQSRLLRERTHPQKMSLAFWRSLENRCQPFEFTTKRRSVCASS
jgi:hypothetical protein